MAQKRPLWYSNLVLVTLERLGKLIICFLMANLPYLPNFRALGISHGPEEALVVHQIGPGYLVEVGQLCHWLPRSQYELHAKFQISGATYIAFLTFVQIHKIATCRPAYRR